MPTLVLLVLALLPVAIAWRAPHRAGADPDAVSKLWRLLLGVSLAYAGLIVGFTGFLSWSTGVGLSDQSFRAMWPYMFFVWVPWSLMFRYLTALREPSLEDNSAQRGARFEPRRPDRTVRRAWLCATGLWLVAAATLLARTDWPANPVVLILGLATPPVWLAMGYWNTGRLLAAEPETYSGAGDPTRLSRAYERRRGLTAWSVLVQTATMVLFSVALAALHPASSTILLRLPVLAIVVLGLLAGAHWWLRRRFDREIASAYEELAT